MDRFLKLSFLGLFFSLCVGVVSCDPYRKPHEPHEQNTLLLTDKVGATISTVPAGGKQILLQLKSSSEWKLSLEGDSFVAFSPNEGGQGEFSLILTIAPNEGEERRAVLVARMQGKEGASARYTIVQQGKTSHGGSSLVGEENIQGDISLIELPRLSGKATDYFITHRVESGKRVNYSLEYNVDAHHSRWVCFSFDAETKQINTGRSNAWGWDPQVPAEYEVYRNDFESRIFARGHLVASHDRVFSSEANMQTFYYTNMSPQRHSFNEGVWLQMEQVVQTWGRSLKQTDVLYVAKGGTIRPDQIESRRSNNKLVVPKYYWMALLKKTKKGWSAIGLLAEHSKPSKVTRLQNQALSIDQLEEFTGLDFFFNLPDEVENRVEALDPQTILTEWPGL